MTVRAYAKINLILSVGDKRADGYHEIKSFMQNVDLYDTLTLTHTENGKITITSDHKYIPCDERNLTYKAADSFFKAAGIDCDGLNIHIKKYIPVGAGLGGGSSDAAAVLRAMNIIYDTGFSREELANIGAQIGADVPFFIYGGARYAHGIGEILTDAPQMPNAAILIVKPRFSVSTPKAYTAFDSFGPQPAADTDAVRLSLENGDINSLCSSLSNSLQSPVEAMYPQIAQIRTKLIQLGADGALMSGAGSAVFGIFRDKKKALSASNLMRYTYGKCYLCKPICDSVISINSIR